VRWFRVAVQATQAQRILIETLLRGPDQIRAYGDLARTLSMLADPDVPVLENIDWAVGPRKAES